MFTELGWGGEVHASNRDLERLGQRGPILPGLEVGVGVVYIEHWCERGAFGKGQYMATYQLLPTSHPPKTLGLP